MVQINAKKTVSIDAKTLKLYCKVCDNFTADLVDAQGETIHEWDGDYVPKIMPGDHYGDYIILDIDIETGRILNWVVPTPEAIERVIGGRDE